MFKVSKLTDYGVLVLSKLALDPNVAKNSTQLAVETGLGQPTAAKLLKMLSTTKIVASQRGCNGGYKLAKDANDINLHEIISSIEGNISVTECALVKAHEMTCCNVANACTLRSSWNSLNTYFHKITEHITLRDLMDGISEKLKNLNLKELN